MNVNDLLLDLASRPEAMLGYLRGHLTAEVVNAHAGDHDNSMAWLLWHTGREIDLQLAMLSGKSQVWNESNYAEKTGLGERGAGIGYGDTPEQAREIQVQEPEVLMDYIVESLAAYKAYVAGLSEADLDDVIDTNYTPAVTRGVRLVSIIDDALQHIGQAFYARGILTK